MFAGEKKEKHHDNDKEQEESMTSEMISEVETNSRGTQVSFRRPIHNVCEKKIQTSMHRGGQSSQEHSTHLNFKKPPISVLKRACLKNHSFASKNGWDRILKPLLDVSGPLRRGQGEKVHASKKACNFKGVVKKFFEAST